LRAAVELTTSPFAPGRVWCAFLDDAIASALGGRVGGQPVSSQPLPLFAGPERFRFPPASSPLRLWPCLRGSFSSLDLPAPRKAPRRTRGTGRTPSARRWSTFGGCVARRPGEGCLPATTARVVFHAAALVYHTSSPHSACPPLRINVPSFPPSHSFFNRGVSGGRPVAISSFCSGRAWRSGQQVRRVCLSIVKPVEGQVAV